MANMNTGINISNDNADKVSMVECTKLASFFLWEYSGYQNTLALWYCAEDIASFFERCRMYTLESIYDILRLSKNDREYKAFIRHLAYRIHLYTGVQDEGFNWYTAEKLLENGEWREATVLMSNKLREMREGSVGTDYRILSPMVKNLYSN